MLTLSSMFMSTSANSTGAGNDMNDAGELPPDGSEPESASRASKVGGCWCGERVLSSRKGRVCALGIGGRIRLKEVKSKCAAVLR